MLPRAWDRETFRRRQTKRNPDRMEALLYRDSPNQEATGTCSCMENKTKKNGTSSWLGFLCGSHSGGGIVVMHPCQLEQGPTVTNLAREKTGCKVHSLDTGQWPSLSALAAGSSQQAFRFSGERPLIVTEPGYPP